MIALFLSLLIHVVIGASLYFWPVQQKPPTPVETKVVFNLVKAPKLQQSQVNAEIAQSAQALSDPITAKMTPREPAGQSAQADPSNAPTVKRSAPATLVAPSVKPAVQANAAEAVAAFLARLEQRKDYPYMARKRGQTGTVTIRVHIAADGGLRDATIINSSGVAILDNAAIALVRQSCPFRHETGEELRMTVPINYNLKD